MVLSIQRGLIITNCNNFLKNPKVFQKCAVIESMQHNTHCVAYMNVISAKTIGITNIQGDSNRFFIFLYAT